jgi:hypothetical protein
MEPRPSRTVPRPASRFRTADPAEHAWFLRFGRRPAAAVYFRDPDGHLLEYLAMLDAAPRPDLGIVSWSQWQAAVRTETVPDDAITP